MVLYKGKHSFACHRLMQNGFEISFNGKRILRPPIFPPNKILKTEIALGKFPEGQDEIKIKHLSYNDLERKGFQITRRSVKGKYFVGQKIEYLIVRKNLDYSDVGIIPEGHRIDFDVINNRLRLIGFNVSKHWIELNPTERQEIKEPFDPTKYEDDSKFYDDFMKNQLIESGFTFKESLNIKTIPEIPIMMGEDGRTLICLPEKRDNPIICLAGERRMGRSFLTHRIIDHVYHKWNKKCIIVNDALRETDTWCLEWQQKEFINQLERIGEPTLPLPMVYLHPKTNTLKNLIHKGETGFEISLPFKEVMLNLESFFEGSEKSLPPKSAQRLRNLIFDDEGKVREDGLLSKKTYPEMKELVDTEIPAKQELVRDAINNFLRDQYTQQIFDVSNNINPRWTLKFPEGITKDVYSWNACLMADLVPSIVNSDIRFKQFFPQYVKFILDDLFKKQTSDEWNIKNRTELFIMIDEPQSLFSNPILSETISKIARESGMARIGMLYVPQNINKVPEDLKLVTNTIIAYNCKKEQASAITSDFDMVDYKKEELRSLKKFEAILFTTQSYTTYDIYTGEKNESDEPIRGRVICSNSAHKPPKMMKEKNDKRNTPY